MQGENIRLDKFQVGEPYSRSEMAVLGEVRLPTDSMDRNWMTGIVEFDNAALLLVTLEKEEYTYDDRFEGQTFWWQSQNRQTQSSPVIQALATGKIPPCLFVRVKRTNKGKTQPFIYCGRLSTPEMAGDKPVTCRFQALDFLEDASPELEEIYSWKPLGGTKRQQSRRRQELSRNKPRKSRGQGVQLDPKRRKALERHSMNHAKRHYRKLGFSVEDTSSNNPYDLECRKGRQLRRVEVKGTQNAGLLVRVTIGEVRAAREEGIVTDLYILHSVRLSMKSGRVYASGGELRKIEDWNPEDVHLRPTSFNYMLSSE